MRAFKIKVGFFVLAVAIGLGLSWLGSELHAQDSNFVPGPHTLQVTIGAGTNTQISTTSIPVKQLFVQNNATHNIRVGDSNTTSSRGALISGGATPPGGSITSGAFGMQAASDLKFWFIAGTNGDVVDVIYIQ